MGRTGIKQPKNGIFNGFQGVKYTKNPFSRGGFYTKVPKYRRLREII